MAKFRGAVLSCATCGKTFKVPPSRANTAKYCSPTCAGPGRGAAMELPRAAIVCKWCGKTFFERKCHASRRVYCSHECRYADPAYSEAISDRTTGDLNGNWKDGTTKHSDGYVYERCSDHPLAKFSYVLQHRLVVERYLRERLPKSPCLIKIGDQLYLRPELVVHHKDGNRENNDVSNLQILTMSAHSKLHNAIRRKQKENPNG